MPLEFQHNNSVTYSLLPVVWHTTPGFNFHSLSDWCNISHKNWKMIRDLIAFVLFGFWLIYEKEKRIEN
jgi:hypothetical protein